MSEHIVTIDEGDDRAYWECSCGRGGSSAPERVDLASDKHISADETRIDRSRGTN